MTTDKMAPHPWAGTAAVPELTSGEIHAFGVALDASDHDERAARAALSADEVARCDRFKFPHLRRRYAVGRAAVRSILASALDVSPAALEFAYGPQGKPALARPDATLTFNVSHSDDLALVAVGMCESLGVDVERRDPGRGCREIATRFFAPDEVAALDRVPPHEYLRAFYRCWTRKESYIKACGGGLSIPLTSFVVSLDEAPRLLRVDGAVELGVWSLFSNTPADDFEACVAARGAGGIHWWRWTKPLPV